jgi:hypothetical protein
VSATVQQEGREARRGDIEQALGKVLAGHSFRSSAQCQALLRYIVEHSLSRENEMLRERVIGINVFGRPSDYDSGNDPIVRARAAEVRKRLAQHYLHGEGASEELRIEIPPGSYRAVFATRNTSASTDVRRGTELSDGLTASSASQVGELRKPLDIGDDKAGVGSPTLEDGHTIPRRPQWIDGGFKSVLVAITSFGFVMGVVGFLVGHLSTATTFTHQDVQGLQKSPSASDDPVASFWAPFLREDHSPIIAYANAMFLIDGSGDLFRFRHGASDNRGVSVDAHLAQQFATNSELVAGAGPLFYDNGYTGTGDLRAMAMLIAQLAHQGATPLVESSYDISTDDLKQHNVILLGSSAENLAVEQLVPTGDFLFEGPMSSRDPWSDQIVNSQPRSGEQSKYATVRDPVTHVLREDYALISFQPGVTPEHQIAILGGIDTTGTEGAALLVTSKAGVEELSNALSQVKTSPQAGKGRAFQALVRVDVKKGYQVLGSHLVTIHPLNATKPAAANGSSSP